MNGFNIAFFVIPALLAVAGAIWSVLATRVFHSALGLGVALVAVAALYVSMEQTLLGVIQLLVYVGGILTLLVFAVMFVAGDEADQDDTQVEARP